MQVSGPVGSDLAANQQDYEQTHSKDTISAWENYLRKHPNSEYEKQARQRLSDLEEIHQRELEEERRRKIAEDEQACRSLTA